MKHQKILYILVAVFAVVVSIAATVYYVYFRYPTNYIKTQKRDHYVIETVDTTLLDPYISKKQPTLVVFWASWCSYCRDEANELNNFILHNPNIPVIVVSSDKEENTLREYLDKNAYQWFVVLDTEKKIRNHIDPGSSGIPAVYLLDNKQKILSSYKDGLTEKEFLSFYQMTFDPNDQNSED